MDTHPPTSARAAAVAATFLLVVLAGCTTGQPACHGAGDAVYHDGPAPLAADASPCRAYAEMGFDGVHWPDLTGHTLTIVDHGAFDAAFAAAKPLFENRTGARVEHVAADDAGTALRLAVQDHRSGGGSFDVIYGLDNILLPKAVDEGILVPYTPVLGERVAPQHRSVPTQQGAWLATPVDHGYIAVNIDPRARLPVQTLDDVADHAGQLVVEDPRFSSPGLGFLVATVQVYGEDGYLDYWQRLFDNGVTVTSGWTEAYVDRFSGGYGQFDDGARSDKAMVVSYTTSPAYEMHYGYDVLNSLVLQPGSVFQQVQTMAILEGADMAAAQAWIEFTLTDDFQQLAASHNAIYPVVDTEPVQASVHDVFEARAPPPESLVQDTFAAQELAQRVDAWVAAWTTLYENNQA